jgi:hypothetical protein
MTTMKEETLELIKTYRRKPGFDFIVNTIQKGRIRPARYVHALEIPAPLYEEMVEKQVINLNDYFINQSAFFELRHDMVIISFAQLFCCEDLHHRVDHYLVIKGLGYYPIKRIGVSRMNFDEAIL